MRIERRLQLRLVVGDGQPRRDEARRQLQPRLLPQLARRLRRDLRSLVLRRQIDGLDRALDLLEQDLVDQHQGPAGVEAAGVLRQLRIHQRQLGQGKAVSPPIRIAVSPDLMVWMMVPPSWRLSASARSTLRLNSGESVVACKGLNWAISGRRAA